MVWLVLGVLLVLLLAGTPVERALRARREVRLDTAHRFRVNRKAAEEDVTVFGEQLAELHVDTLTHELDAGMLEDYRRALDSYDRARALLARAESATDVLEVTTALEDGRYAHACVLAARDDRPPPERRSPCFFNPQHGPAAADIAWTPPNGVERRIAVCSSDARRLTDGEAPDVRMVRVGDRYVPWFAAGEEYDAYAHGYFGHRADAHRIAAARVMARHATSGGGMGPAGTGAAAASLGMFGF